ncbi:unnamed protein product [Heligmosomoides polygyrus]|uniref:GAF domain-containing protein n=1 Tax=Heligmosomoides polygyrus TaxID=6339 RepID=A0A183G2F0_HELPZ|nr:unnamed protein product [Heligmosomoides polygyrus]
MQSNWSLRAGVDWKGPEDEVERLAELSAHAVVELLQNVARLLLNTQGHKTTASAGAYLTDYLGPDDGLFVLCTSIDAIHWLDAPLLPETHDFKVYRPA